MAQKLRAEYETRVMGDSTARGNNVPAMQKKFGAADGALVFMKTKGDIRLYRGLLGVCGVGLATTVVCLSMMATGTMPKKERPS